MGVLRLGAGLVWEGVGLILSRKGNKGHLKRMISVTLCHLTDAPILFAPSRLCVNHLQPPVARRGLIYFTRRREGAKKKGRNFQEALLSKSNGKLRKLTLNRYIF